MKLLCTALIILISINLQAKTKLLYTILEHSWNDDIHEDSMHIKGMVTYDKVPTKDNFGKVTALNFKSTSFILADGQFDIIISKQSKGIFFFQNGYREVIIKLNGYENFNEFKINITGETHFAQIMVEKPVIYLYSDISIETEIKLTPKGKMVFTYPIYDQFWRIKTGTNGRITDLKTGKTHPYLFWEANQNGLNFRYSDQKMEGFRIKTDTAIIFLEHQLKALGLNGIESTDFITYWAPRIMQTPYALLQFSVNTNYNQIFGGISFTKTPDSMQRIGLLFSGLNDQSTQLELTPQKFKPFKRTGFTVVEWGGAELSQFKTILAES